MSYKEKIDMMKQTISAIRNGKYDKSISGVCSGSAAVEKEKERLISLEKDFIECYGEPCGKVRLFSAPGRTEVGGNHTDHNHGKVLAASVDLDVVALVCERDDGIVRVTSRGFGKTDRIDLNERGVKPEEKGHSCAQIRGVIERLADLGYAVGGFDAVTVSSVMPGSGLSSSAAFEVLIGTIVSYIFNGGNISPVEIAKAAQYSENHYFDKPCGLMDQMACSVGGFVKIDFKDTDEPVITPVDFDFSSCGHKLVITDSRGSHSGLTDDYAAIRSEMEGVAALFGKSCLREIEENDFLKELPALHGKCSERALLRAMHFYAENRRVDAQAESLEKGDFENFKKLIVESGFSSYMYNQNVFSPSKASEQPVALALALSEMILKGRGAWRVHGGGFAGTIQAFVPDDLLDAYIDCLESVFGKGACYVLSIRPFGGTEFIEE